MEKLMLSRDQEAIAQVIKHLDPRQRMTRVELMEHAGISNERKFYLTLEQLRDLKFLIGSSKHWDDKGYYRIWTPDELNKTIHKFEAERRAGLQTITTLKIAHEEEQKRGYSLFDLI